ncbi:MAG: FAD-dependent oxidoreductase [Victivallales bacterium]|nr:FAD-dependent oxidoreductase [Victivallales bacterium]
MTKTLMFKMAKVKAFNKPALKAKFSGKRFPVAIQNNFMCTPLLRDDEILLNLTAVVGDATDPSVYAAMHRELQAQIPVVAAWLKREYAEFAEAEVTAVAPMMGVRYSRSIVGRRRLTMEDMGTPLPPPEPVGLCGEYIGGHYVQGYDSPWGHAITGHPAIPYGALRSINVDNLAASGRNIDVEPQAISAVRLCVPCMASGQAAGIAAALGMPDHDVLARELTRQNCLFQSKTN